VRALLAREPNGDGRALNASGAAGAGRAPHPTGRLLRQQAADA